MTVHIIGGGIAGLAASVECTRRGHKVVIYEAAPELGGRARTYFSAVLNTHIDNGAHAVLANNANVQDYLVLCGARDELIPHGIDGLQFYDVRSAASWHLKLPAAVWSKNARPPGVGLRDLLAGLKLFASQTQYTAADVLSASKAAAERLWEPLCTAALNTPLSAASAAALATVVRQMIMPGGLRDGLHLPKHSLSATYVEPAVKWLTAQGAQIACGMPLRAVEISGQDISGLVFDTAHVLEPDDKVILALPPWSPILQVVGVETSAFTYAPIINAHFKLTSRSSSQFTGLVGGHSQWLWVRGDVASVTISAADALQSWTSDQIAQTVWTEIAPVLGLKVQVLPPAHVIKERRATLRHVPGLDRHRPGSACRYTNLFLAGDWVITDANRPLPCTLENAVQSGFAAAKLATTI